MPTLETGHVFERYRVIRWLGSGVSGESYEAEDAMLLRKVTLKLIHPQSTLPDSARRQFFRELQGISALSHAYLASVLDYGEMNGRLYLARKFVSSGSLLGTEGRLWFRPQLNVSDAIHFTHQLAQVLHYIHTRGYLHGAITFSNILVLRGPNLENEPDYAPFLLADVGLANFARHFGQEPGQPLPVTAAPEQLDGRITPLSDQFALAVLLYFWLAGRPPYLGTPEEIEHLKRTESITPLTTLNSLVSIKQNGILLRALSAHPEDRYPSILLFADALLKTLPPVIPAIPITDPVQVDDLALPSFNSESIEREQEQEVVELTFSSPAPAEEPAISVISAQENHAMPDFDREPSVTPVLEIEVEQGVEAAPTQFETIPQTEPFFNDDADLLSAAATPEVEALVEDESIQTTPISVSRVIIASPYADAPYEFKLEGEEISIGRAGSSAILLDKDNLTSRHHALLKRAGNHYQVFDMRSANGVFVNGQKIVAESGYELLDGDHISIGNYELIFRAGTSTREHVSSTGELQPKADYEFTQLV